MALLTDSSTNNLQLSAFGNTAINTTTFKYGGGAVYFDGTGDYIRGNIALSYSSDFTIECWLYRTDSGAVLTFFEAGDIQPAQGGLHLYIDGSNRVVWNNGLVADLQGGLTPLNQWVHVAAVRYNGTNTLYVNGVSVDSGSQSFPVTNNIITIGGAPEYSFYFPGYIDDFRITTGIARYTTNFTPPEFEFINPSDPYLSNVSLLLHMDGLSGSQTFTDSSLSAKAITAFGDAQISTSVKKFGTGSAYFDGDGDYVQTIISNWNPGVNNEPFTIEFWVYRVGSGTQVFVAKHGGVNAWNGTNGLNFNFYYTDSILYFEYWGGSSPQSIGNTVSVPTNQWVHLAAAYDGTTTRIFVNGVLQGTTSTANYGTTTSANTFEVGAQISGTFPLNGYIDELRVTKGVARYTTTFVPHTAPFASAPITIPTSGLVAWFKADAGVTESGGVVTAWADQSGLGNNATAFNGPVLITNQLNGRPAIDFDGTNDYMTFTLTPSLTSGSGRTYIQIYKYDALVGQSGTLDGGSTQAYIFQNGTSLYYNDGSQIGPVAGTFTTDYFIETIVVDGSTGSTTLRINGVDEVTGSMNRPALTNFVIGARNAGSPSEYANFKLIETIVYNRALTTAEIQQIETYANVP